MKKFDDWNSRKKQIASQVNEKQFHERDMLFISMGKNIGFEQDGKGDDFLRPVVVYKKFSKDVFLGIPLTHTDKDSKFYCTFTFHGEVSVAILSQIRLFDAKRISYGVGRISDSDYNLIKTKLIALLQ